MPTASTSCHPIPTAPGNSTTSDAVPLSTHLENVGDIPTIVSVDRGDSSSENHDCSLSVRNELVHSLNSNIAAENSLHLDVDSPNEDSIPIVSNNVESVTKCGGATSTNEVGL
ncbi:hypothetical protein V6N12_028593 [Hibiscus sabdariffa]|uniref:Uncharacterized protein n=1 Tax=Hibiscus sabdariffa TaxID=183260 RepID=A0ABR2F6B1_9ROSI